ncbi:MAG TPA: hypothetical protein VE954_24890 [Oligoflexus sp.]|uniref:hypothetical protein n=1 Tax=Oligoflexus sp. TaxID=1971216 RepID=UPI002D6EE255|nr:hypothetical protein [Oligoflexus sp.]HYX36355.1 hypothetical protein [Oligoflexus sp.]
MAQEITYKEKEAFRKRVAYWMSKGFDKQAAHQIASLPTKEARRSVVYTPTDSHNYKQTFESKEPPTPIAIAASVTSSRNSGTSGDPIFGLAELKAAICAVGSLVCSGALIVAGAEAGAWTLEAWFWSILIVTSGTILLSTQFKGKSLKSWIQKMLGGAILCLGYCVMYAGITEEKEKTISEIAAGSSEVMLLQKQIRDIEGRLAPSRSAIADMHAVKYRTAIARIQLETKPLEDELAQTRRHLIAAEKRAALKASAGSVTSQSVVEWMRRLILEPLNILCLHGLMETLPNIVSALRKRNFRLTGAPA